MIWVIQNERFLDAFAWNNGEQICFCSKYRKFFTLTGNEQINFISQ